MINIEQTKKEVYGYLNLFRQKLQEIQENQEVLAINQELIVKQNNKILQAMDLLIKGLEEPDEDEENDRDPDLERNVYGTDRDKGQV